MIIFIIYTWLLYAEFKTRNWQVDANYKLLILIDCVWIMKTMVYKCNISYFFDILAKHSVDLQNCYFWSKCKVITVTMHFLQKC